MKSIQTVLLLNNRIILANVLFIIGTLILLWSIIRLIATRYNKNKYPLSPLFDPDHKKKKIFAHIGIL